MTRQEAEQRILEKLIEIVKIYKEYDENGEVLNMAYDNNDIFCFNKHWEVANPIYIYKNLESEK